MLLHVLVVFAQGEADGVRKTAPCLPEHGLAASDHPNGFALSENYEDMKKHATMRGAGVPRCNDVPDTFNVLFHETYRENEMCIRDSGYNDELAVGTLACSGTIGCLIPPSTPFIIYGVLAQQSIGDLFVAGLIPGLDLYKRQI